MPLLAGPWRRSPWPRNLTDAGSTLFLAVALPAIFYFELGTVLPAVCGAGTAAFWLHASCGAFIVLQIATNHAALMLVDPSIRGRQLCPPPTTAQTAKNADAAADVVDATAIAPQSHSWHFCAACEALVPPRAWHCATCRVCILRRDHHCAFSGCCVGHHNQRYFWWLCVWLCVGTVYASYFNTRFVFGVHAERFWTPMTAVKLFFPFAVIVLEPSVDQAWLTAYLVCVVGAAFTLFLCVYHGQNMWAGALVPERGAGGRLARRYDVGGWRNVRTVLGERWWLGGLSPLVRCELLVDGVAGWETVAAEAASRNKSI